MQAERVRQQQQSHLSDTRACFLEGKNIRTESNRGVGWIKGGGGGLQAEGLICI